MVGNNVNSGTSRRLVSVTILNYNGREHLEVCLSSLRDLSFPKEDLEIIVVDNASTDDSVDFLTSEFPNVVLVRNEVNLGFSRAANRGAANANGEYLAFLNNDMRVDKNWLSSMLETVRSGQFACVGSTVLNWEGTAVDFMGRRDDPFCLDHAYSDKTFLSSSAAGGPTFRTLFVSCGAAIFRREVFQSLGGFDPDFFLYHEDVDLGWRLWLQGYECAVSTESLVYHRGGATSSRLTPEFLQTLSQKHALFSVFKNLEARNLREVLPLLLFFLLERGRWIPAARSSLEPATREFRSSLDSLIAKRNKVQATRTRSDAEIFEIVGHPFNFLLQEGSYEPVRQLLVDCSADIGFDPTSVESARAAIAEWLNRAHFLYESKLTAELERVLVRET